MTIDAAIIGGGIAGTWLLNLLHRHGYNVVLAERNALGCDQTLASQGMIHGGLKYALSGALTGASEAIASMPERWRACLRGGLNEPGNVDLKGLPLLSDRYFMFADDGALGRLTGFFAAKALRGRIERLETERWPGSFNGFNGVVYELNDFVIDTPALLDHLVRGLEGRVFELSASGENIARTEAGYRIELNDTTIYARYLLCCAGNGSQALMRDLAIDLQVQQRPLKQVIIRPQHKTELFAHCLTGIKSNEPRLTITTHRADDGGVVWYLGGTIATRGVGLSDDAQIEHARAEIEACVPWLYWHDAQFETLTVNRAEPYQKSGHKPDNAYVEAVGNFIQCFPTKLTLTPHLGDQVLKLLEPPQHKQQLNSQHLLATRGKHPW